MPSASSRTSNHPPARHRAAPAALFAGAMLLSGGCPGGSGGPDRVDAPPAVDVDEVPAPVPAAPPAKAPEARPPRVIAVFERAALVEHAAEAATADGGTPVAIPAGSEPEVEFPGPSLPVEPAASADDEIWTLPETPKQFVWTHPRGAGALKVRLLGPRGLAWPAEITLVPGASEYTATIAPSLPFQTGRKYDLLAEERDGGRVRAWSVRLSVERGSDQPPPWRAEPAPQKKSGRRR